MRARTRRGGSRPGDRSLRLVAVSVVATLGSVSVALIPAQGAGAATSAPPTVSSFAATPSTLTSAGGSITLSASVTNAISCAFSSNKTVNGLPGFASCSNGTVDEVVTVPANTSKKAAKYTFDVAVNGAKTVKAKLTLSVEPYCVPGPGAYLYGCNLAGAKLVGVNLTGADLSGADLTGANVSGADLTGTDLLWTELTGANLTGVTSGGITGTPGSLPTNWLLVNGYLVGSDAVLTGADLAGTDLSGATLVGVKVSGTTFSGADLDNVTSGGVTGTPASLPTDWSLVDGYFVGPRADLSGANLSDADLSGFNLAGANLYGSDLSGTNLSGVNLFGVRSGGIKGTPASLPEGWSLANGYLVGPPS
jgi:uncharacterized protein YjbI with pentapeptide repeats